MIDLVASIALLAGVVLMLLASIGLVRFPDVFTRMHAATKAATVGVIATTAAAALEAGTLGGALVLFLVIALLFLSGPLGMSLLARAAYHDPETPRSPRTRELPVAMPVPESTKAQRASGSSPFLGVWLFLVWVAAFGSLAPNVVLGGALVSGGVAWLLRRLAPRWPEALLHPFAAARFVAHFVRQLVVSTWDVIRSLRMDPAQIEPAVIEVPLRARTRNEVTLLMNAVSFTPGTVALELHDHHLFVHVLHTHDPGVVARDIMTMEDRIIEAFGAVSQRSFTRAGGRYPNHVTEDV